jgi:hypothetical protein
MRCCLWVLALAIGSLWAADSPAPVVLHGKLIVRAGQPATVETNDHKLVQLSGDESTSKVLADKRLDGYQVEARGHFTAPDRFAIDPFHTRGLKAVENGKVKLITYFCDVCNIRANTPGPCACCQKETVLSLQDPSEIQP